MTMLMPTLLVGAALLAAPVQAPTSPPAKAPVDQPAKPAAHAMHAEGLSAADSAFVKKTAEGGMAEVSLAKLAQSKSTNADVKSLAEKLERDHSTANDELKSLADQKKVMLATVPSAAASATEARLSKLSGAAFDKAYITAMLTDHQKDIAAFERTAQHAADADLKAWAAKTLPTLKDHLQQVQQIQKSMGRASS